MQNTECRSMAVSYLMVVSDCMGCYFNVADKEAFLLSPVSCIPREGEDDEGVSFGQR